VWTLRLAEPGHAPPLLRAPPKWNLRVVIPSACERHPVAQTPSLRAPRTAGVRCGNGGELSNVGSESVHRILVLRRINSSPAWSYDADLLDPLCKGVEAKGDITLPPHDAPLDGPYTIGDFLADFRSGRAYDGAAAKAYGRILLDHLLPLRTELGEYGRRAIDAARTPGLRLELVLDPEDPQLDAIPFELLADGRGFVFRRARHRLLRSYAGLPIRDVALSPRGTARLLVAWANPSSPDGTRVPDKVFEAHERAAGSEAQRLGLAAIPPLRNAHRSSLRKLLGEHPHIEVVVWIGHGVAAGGKLLLHGDEAPDYPNDFGTLVAAGDFASDLRTGGVQLVFLWTCHGAGHALEPFGGVAYALLAPDQGNAGAVLGSHAALDAEVSARFAGALFSAWAHGGGDLEDAVAAARAQMDETTLLWARPTLYARCSPMTPAALRPPADPLVEAAPRGVSDRLRALPLPTRTPHFVGREDLVEHATARLRLGRVVVLEGLPGIGKTELALAVAYRVEADGGRVVFFEAQQQMDLSNLRSRMGVAVGLTTVESDADLFSAFEPVEALVVLDNAEDLLPSEAAHDALRRFLGGLLARAPGLRLLVTSRRQLGPLGDEVAEPVDVPPLTPEATRELFVAECGPRLHDEELLSAAGTRLLELLDGHPRAVVLVASHVGRGETLQQLVGRLEHEGASAMTTHDFYGFDFQETADARLRRDRLVSTMNLSYRALERESEAAVRAFEFLGFFPAGLAQAVFAQAIGDEDGSLVRVLLRHNLVVLRGDDRRLNLPAPIRAYANWRLRRRGIDRLALERAALATAAQLRGWGDRLGTPESRSVLRWFLREEPNVVALLAARTDGAAMPVAPAALALVRPWGYAAGYAGRARDVLEVVTPLVARLDWSAVQRDLAAPVLQALGDLRRRVDDLEGARAAYEEALPIYREIHDRLGEANTLLALGDLRRRVADLEGARAAYEEAL
ncbi:MAG: CHAT domain-containing protein, partial [Planctomycetes bacterium]|nr:CHAT domain-containing protein [Planctomycetota bacterium]